MAQIQIRVHEGKILDPALKLKDLLSSLQDGEFVVSIVPINPLTSVDDYRKCYFALIDECVLHTGHKKYEIHSKIKQDLGIESTREFVLSDWMKFIKDIKWWAYQNLNMYL